MTPDFDNAEALHLPKVSGLGTYPARFSTTLTGSFPDLRGLVLVASWIRVAAGGARWGLIDSNLPHHAPRGK